MSDFTCYTCFDTNKVDNAGGEIPCPEHVRYHPTSVTIEPTENPKRPYRVIDSSWRFRHVDAEGDMERCMRRQRVRQGVIKAAITRRKNKAARVKTTL